MIFQQPGNLITQSMRCCQELMTRLAAVSRPQTSQLLTMSTFPSCITSYADNLTPTMISNQAKPEPDAQCSLKFEGSINKPS